MPDVRLPNGQVIKNVPEGTTKADLLMRLQGAGYDVSEFGVEPSRPAWKDEAEQPQMQDETLGQRLSERGAELQKIIGGTYKDQGTLSDVLQAGGQIAGGALDILGEGVSQVASAVTPDIIEEPVKEYAGKAAEFVGQQPVVQDVMRYGQQLAEQYPEAARNIGAGLNIAGAIPAVRGAKAIATGAKKSFLPDPQTVEVLRQAERSAFTDAFNAAAESGTELKAGALRGRVYSGVRKRFSEPQVGKLDPDLHPQAFQAMRKIGDRLSGKTVKPEELENVRRIIGDYIERSKGEMGKDTSDTVKLYEIQNVFDDVVDEVSPEDFVRGDKQFVDSFKKAREISTVRRKAEPLEKIFMDAELHAKNSSEGLSLKNGFRSLAKNEKKMKRYTPKEQFLIRKAAKTGNAEGILNVIGGLNPFGGKLGFIMNVAGLTGAGAAGVTVPWALPVAGMAAQAASNVMGAAPARGAFRNITRQLEPKQGVESLAERARRLFTRTGEQ